MMQQMPSSGDSVQPTCRMANKLLDCLSLHQQP